MEEDYIEKGFLVISKLFEEAMINEQQRDVLKGKELIFIQIRHDLFRRRNVCSIAVVL